jgi:uncharacterized membrane protein
MNSSQIHLALTHVPVILSFIGLVILIISFFKKNSTLTNTSFYILLAAGLFTLPVYFTGEGAEEIVEDMPGVTKQLIGQHEEFAGIALITIAISAVIALAGILFKRRDQLLRVIKLTTLFFALASSAAMAQTAHLGGQIRHSEIRSGFVAQNESINEGKENEGKQSQTDSTNKLIQQDNSFSSEKDKD